MGGGGKSYICRGLGIVHWCFYRVPGYRKLSNCDFMI